MPRWSWDKGQSRLLRFTTGSRTCAERLPAGAQSGDWAKMREDRLSRASLVICPPPTLPRDPKLQPAAVQMKTINKKKASAPPLRNADHICEATPSPRSANADSGVFRDSLISNFSTSEDPTNFSAVGRKLANAATATGTSDANRLGSRARQPLHHSSHRPQACCSSSALQTWRLIARKTATKCDWIDIQSNLLQAEGPSAQQTEEVQEEERSLPPV